MSYELPACAKASADTRASSIEYPVSSIENQAKNHLAQSAGGLIFAIPFIEMVILTYGVMVALLILVQSVKVRILIGQQEKENSVSSLVSPFYFRSSTQYANPSKAIFPQLPINCICY